MCTAIRAASPRRVPPRGCGVPRGFPAQGTARWPQRRVRSGQRGRAREHRERDERGRPLGMRRREERRHRAALVHSEQRRALRPGRPHHGRHILHPLLEARHDAVGNPVGGPSSALVEQDQPSEGGEAPVEGSERRVLASRLEVRNPDRDRDEVELRLANQLVSDAEIPARGVAGADVHRRSLTPVQRYC